MRISTGRPAALGAALALTAVLAACGSSASPASTSGKAPASKAPAASTPADKPSTADPAIVAPAPTGKVALPASGDLAPVVRRVPTKDRVVFLTQDDGFVQDPEWAAYVAQKKLPISMFLVDQAAQEDPAFFKGMQASGATVEDHSFSHPDLTKLSAAAQKKQICTTADDFAKTFGKRPTLLRPPYGSYNATTQRMAKECGMNAVVLWTASMPMHKLYYASGSKFQPGDIILTHFRKFMIRDINRLLADIKAQGFTVARLEDYI